MRHNAPEYHKSNPNSNFYYYNYYYFYYYHSERHMPQTHDFWLKPKQTQMYISERWILCLPDSSNSYKRGLMTDQSNSDQQLSEIWVAKRIPHLWTWDKNRKLKKEDQCNKPKLSSLWAGCHRGPQSQAVAWYQVMACWELGCTSEPVGEWACKPCVEPSPLPCCHVW